MPNMEKDGSNNIWPYSITIGGAGTIQHTFVTQNKFLDANIVATITTPLRGTLSLDINNDTSGVITPGSLNANNKYPVSVNLNGTVTAATAGWISNTAETVGENGVTVGVLNKAGFTINNGNEFICNSPGYVESGSTVLSSITPVTPTASIDTGTNNNYNGLTTYFTKLDNSTNANVTIKPQYSTNAGYVTSASNSITTANTTYWQIKTASPSFTASPSGASTADFTNITTSSTNNGIKVQTSYSINSATITYAAAMNAGWLTSKTLGTTTGSSTVAKASTESNYYYITGITVPTTTNFTLTTVANNSTDNSKVTIINNNNRKIEISTNNGDVYVAHPTSNKGNVYVTPYDGTQTQIINNGVMMTTIFSSSTWTKNSTTKVATMGGYNYTDGYVNSGSLGAATFHNTPTANKTYVDLSDALVSSGGSYVVPELDQDGFLYIDQGYIDYIKISLGHLIPGAESSNATTSDQILQGYTAYDKNGNLITGNIPEKTASDLQFDTTTGIFTTPTGYYASDVTKSIGLAVITPSYTFPGSNDADLDNYLTPTGTSSGDVSITPQYTNTVGYIVAHSSAQSGTRTYYNLKAPTFEKGTQESTLTIDTTNTSSARSIYTAATDTFISIGSSAPALNTTGKVYIKINSTDQIKTTSTGRGAIKSGVTIGTSAQYSHTSYIGIDLYQGEYQTQVVS